MGYVDTDVLQQNISCMTKKGRVTRFLSLIFLFSIIAFPDFIGFRLGIVINLQRIMVVIMLFWILINRHKQVRFTTLILRHNNRGLIFLYLVICFITMVVNDSIGTFMNPLLDGIMIYYLSCYLFSYELDEKDFLNVTTVLLWILLILGVIEAITQFNIFTLFPQLDEMGRSGNYREGAYRIGGVGQHPLGYGLLLLLMLPLACYDHNKKIINIYSHPVLLGLFIINVFATGSRSTLGLAAVELLLLFLLSRNKEKQRNMFVTIPIAILVIMLILMYIDFYPVRLIMIKILTSIDGALGTSLAYDILGYRSVILDSSKAYRELLLKILTLSKLQNFIGLGVANDFSTRIDGVTIFSIDNFYILQYIRYAYIGLISFILLMISQLKNAIIGAFKHKNTLFCCMFVGLIAYFINLWYVDALGTMKCVYLIFGYIYANKKRNSV